MHYPFGINPKGGRKEVIDLIKKQQVILRHLNNDSNRQIARDLGIDKNTVNKYVNEYDRQLRELLESDPEANPEELIAAIVEKPSYNCSKRSPRVSTEEVKTEILICLAENEKKRQDGRGKQQMRGTDIHGYLLKKGFRLSYSTVKRLLRQIEPSEKEAYVRQETIPGQICEFDWGEVKLNIGGTGYHKYQMAAFASAYGNYRFAALFRSQDTAAFQEAHVRFFRFCHGVYHTVVYDNMRVAVRKFVGPAEKEPTEALLQLSTYYRFEFRFCNVRRGNEKSHVERTVDVMRHFAFSEPGKDEFESLEAANVYLLDKCREKNSLPLSDGRIPADTFAEEKDSLILEVPPMPCFIKRKGCSVDKYSTVSVNCVRYSVPDIYAEKKVDVRIYTDRIVIYKDEAIIAEHPRSYHQGSYHLDIFHYLRTLKRKPGALPQSTALLQSDTLIRNIYEKYYNKDAKTFLQVLEIIKEVGAAAVMESLTALLEISPLDLSADKVKVTCDRLKERKEIPAEKGISPLGRKIKESLSQYDRLREVMNPERKVAV